MSFQQVYYTSCTKGLRDSKGFQIHAATPTVESRVLEAVERVGLYVPPMSYPTRPTAQELETFPISLIYEDLGPGTMVLAQAKYTGADYSGRFGNYFTHSVLASRGAFDAAGVLPIQMWGSPDWVTTEHSSTELPALATLSHGPTISPETVRAFLQRGDRLAHLGDFLACVEQALLTKRRMLVIDAEPGVPGGHAVAHWVAAACLVLPRRLALGITFNTYLKNPYQSTALIGGLLNRRDTDFGFASHEVNHQFFVFDFLEGVFSEPMPAPSAYMAAVARLFQEGRHTEVAAFVAFIDGAAPAITVDELPAALAAFRGGEGAVLSGDELEVALRWAARNVRLLDVRVVERLVRAGVAVKPASGLRQALFSLCEAARIAGGLKAASVEPHLLDWFFQSLLMQAPLDFVTAVWQGFRSSPPGGDLTSYQRTMLDHLSKAAEPDRLALLLEIARECGHLQGLADPGMLGERICGPWLTYAKVAEVSDHLAAELGDAFVAGLARKCAQAVRQPADAGPLLQALRGRRLADQIEDAARQQGALALWMGMLVSHSEGGRMTRPMLMVALMQEAQAEVEIDGEGVYDTALHAVWPSGKPTLREWVELVEIEPQPAWLLPKLPLLVQAAVKVDDWRQVDADLARLIRAIDHVAPAAVASHVETARAIRDLATLRSTTALSRDVVVRVFDLPAALAGSAGPALYEALATKLVRSTSPGKTLMLVPDAAPQEFWSAYFKALRSRLDDAEPDEIIRHFTGLCAFERSLPDQFHSGWIDWAFAEASGNWSRTTRARLKKYFEQDGSADADRWAETMSPKASPRRGVSTRMVGLALGAAAVVAGLGVAALNFLPGGLAHEWRSLTGASSRPATARPTTSIPGRRLSMPRPSSPVPGVARSMAPGNVLRPTPRTRDVTKPTPNSIPGGDPTLEAKP